MGNPPRDSGHHDVTDLVDRLLDGGLKTGASDLHFEPVDRGLLVRVRVDGQLIDFDTVPAELAPNVVSRLKVLASLLTYRIDIPQEGSLRWHGGGGDDEKGAVDLRVATFPTIRGERAVVRVFQKDGSLQSIDDLGLAADQVEQLRDVVTNPTGLVIATGPAGSGKSTTLYALVRHLRDHQPERSVITLEDPVEQRIDRVTQIQINPYGELGYARCLRSLLRQDPQVILLGEVRDAETAAIAVGAALTGHLILTTVHSGDPAETIIRFLEMGIPPYQLVSTVNMICSQRLARRLCHKCTDDTRAECSACLGSGYSGRVVIAHIAPIDERVRQLVLREPTAHALRSMLKEIGPDLADRASALLGEGITDANEVTRVLGTNITAPGD